MKYAYAYTYLPNEIASLRLKSFRYWRGKTMDDCLGKAFSHYKTNDFHIEETTRKNYLEQTDPNRTKKYLKSLKTKHNKDIKKIEDHLTKHETQEVKEAFNNACTALCKYLELTGWEHQKDFSGWKDPLSGEVIASSDRAFTKETDRAYYMTYLQKAKSK